MKKLKPFRGRLGKNHNRRGCEGGGFEKNKTSVKMDPPHPPPPEDLNLDSRGVLPVHTREGVP